MYTRCPSCRSEISFDAPSNMANLPDGYKHRIKCPNCGVTIGVKIPRQESYLDAQPIYAPQNPNATSFEPIYNAGEATAFKDVSAKQKKGTGRGRTTVMLLFSLIFVALSIVAYLVNTNVISLDFTKMPWLQYIIAYDGISTWQAICTNFEGFNVAFNEMASASILWAFLYLVPMLLFSLSAINLIVSFGCLIGGKYSRVYNLIMALLVGGFAVLALFDSLLIDNELLRLIGSTQFVSLGDYFKNLIDTQAYLIIAVAGVGAIMFIFSLGFLAPLKKKQKSIE